MKKFVKLFQVCTCLGFISVGQIAYAIPAQSHTMSKLYNEITKDSNYVNLTTMLSHNFTNEIITKRQEVLNKTENFDEKTLSKLNQLDTELVNRAIQLQLFDSWKNDYTEEDLQVMLENTDKERLSQLPSPLQINISQLPNYFEKAMEDINYVDRQLKIIPIDFDN